MEGNYQAAKRGPDGQAIVRTVDDFMSGKSKYITLAGNPKFNGKEYTIPRLEVVGRDGKALHVESELDE